MLDVRSTVHLHDDDLELYVRGRLEPELISAKEPHLWECQTCRERLSRSIGLQLILHPVGETKSGKEYKRTEPRFDTNGEGTLQEFHPLSLDRHKVRIVNVSKNGLGLVSPKAILPGTIVQLRIKDIVELGNVRYCSISDEGFRIGLRLHGDG